MITKATGTARASAYELPARSVRRGSAHFRVLVVATVGCSVASGALAQIVLPPDAYGSADRLSSLRTGTGASSPPIDWNAGVAARVTYTDNALLSAKGSERSDTIYELAPFLSVRANGPRLQGTATYAPRYVARNLDSIPDSEGLRHRLDATGNALLVGDSVGVLARATVADVNTNPFGALSFDPTTSATNRSTYKSFDVSPYARGRIGTNTEYIARYGYGWVDDGIRNYVISQQSVSALLANLTGTYPYGWRVYADQRFVSYSNGALDYDRSFITALAHYSPVRELRLGLGTNFARSNLVLSESGENGGWGPTATVEWSPSPRTSLFAGWAGTYFGHIAQARASHRAENWVFGLSYRDTIQDSVSAGLVSIDPNQIFGGDGFAPSANPVVQQLGGFGTIGQPSNFVQFGTINSALVRVRATTGSIAYVTPRTAYTLSGFLSQQDNALRLAENVPGGNIPQDLSQRGADLRVRHRLSPQLSLGTTLRWLRSESDLLAAQSSLAGIQVDAQYLLTSNASLSIGARHNRQRGDATAAVSYDENAVFADVGVRF